MKGGGSAGIPSRPGAGHFIGRDDDLATLRGALDAVTTSGKSRVVLVRGEPGIGKTTLLKAFMDQARVAPGPSPLVDPPLVGYGQAMTDASSSDAFQAVRECLRSLVASAERLKSRDRMVRVARAFAATAPDWLESVPVVGAVLAAGMKTGMSVAQATGVDAAHLTSGMHQLVALVEDLLLVSPVVLVLDDLHWADASTIDVAMTLALKIDGPLLLVLAYRPDDLRVGLSGVPHPLTRAIFRLRRYRPDTKEIELRRLPDEHVRSLIAALANGHPSGVEDVEELIRVSGGVPLYVESLMALSERGSGVTPSSLRDVGAVLEERLSFLDGDQQRLLETATAVGFTFEVDLLAQLLRADVDDVYDRLDVLVRDHHVVVPAESVGTHDRYSLHHPLLFDVLRERAQANGPRWRRLHQRLIDLLLAQPEVTDDLAARAAMSALLSGDGRAAGLAMDAAARHFRAGAVGKAREYAEAAMDVGGGSEFALDAGELVTRCLVAEGDHAAAAAKAAEIIVSRPPSSAGPAARRTWSLRLLRARSLRLATEWDAASAELSVLDGELDDEPACVGAVLSEEFSRTRAESLLVRAEMDLCGPDQDFEQCIKRCEDVLSSSVDMGLVSRAEGHRGLGHLAAYRPREAESCLQAAVSAARTLAHPSQLYDALFWHAKKKIACLELDAGWSIIEEMRAVAERSGVSLSSPVHHREGSRLWSTRGDMQRSAELLGRYFDAAPEISLAPLKALLCLQVVEIADLFDGSRSLEFLEQLTRAAERCSSAERRFILTECVDLIGTHQPVDAPLSVAVDLLAVPPSAAAAADTVFRFNIPDLGRLRGLVRSGAVPLG